MRWGGVGAAVRGAAEGEPSESVVGPSGSEERRRSPPQTNDAGDRLSRRQPPRPRADPRPLGRGAHRAPPRPAAAARAQGAPRRRRPRRRARRPVPHREPLGRRRARLRRHGHPGPLRAVLLRRHRLRARPGPAPLAGLRPAAGDRVGRVLPPRPLLRGGHDADGLRGRSDHDLPRPGDHVDHALRPRRLLPQPSGGGRGLAQVLPARGLRLGLPPLRHRPRVRRHRGHQPGPDRGRGGGRRRA